jgi:hypothetical protein
MIDLPATVRRTVAQFDGRGERILNLSNLFIFYRKNLANS